jgi:hypothetical protein
MSKLFKLKDWLTVEEAAKHLSTALGEEVTIADIYRLTLDKHLVMSMNFPNKTYGNFGEVVGIEDVRRITPFPWLFDGVHSSHLKNVPSEIIVSDYIGEDQFINWNEKVVEIDGVWDLCMVASERIDVEYIYQQLIGGPEVTLCGIDGVFVRRGEQFCRLVESYDGNEFQEGSLAHKETIIAFLASNDVPKVEAELLWSHYEESRKIYLEKRLDRAREADFYPAGGLPKDGVYVVRTAAIIDFLSRIDCGPTHEKDLSTKERNSMLNLIAALCKEAKMDFNRKGIATALAASTESIGKPLTDDTIRKILKQVQELIN